MLSLFATHDLLVESDTESDAEKWALKELWDGGKFARINS
jgi:hypothetical protein